MDFPKSMPGGGLVDGRFVDENPTTGQPGSLISAVWANALMDELLGVIRSAGLTPNEDDKTQLLQALQGLAASDVKRAVRAAATGPIALSGVQTIDGVALPAGARVLVPKQADPVQNGIYVVATNAWVRASDADEGAENPPGHLVVVQAGTVGAGTIWQLTNQTYPTVGTTPLNYGLVIGRTGVAAGSYRQVTVDVQGRVTAGANPTTLAGYGITDALVVGRVSRQQPLLASPVNGSDYSAGAAVIREAGEVGASNPAEVRDEYAPAIGFSWQGKASGKLGMDYAGVLKWNGAPLLSLASLTAYGIGGQAISTETDLGKYKTGGKFITPATGLVGLPLGWAQGRHVIDVSGGDAYCEQTLNGVGANSGRKAWRVWDGSAWSGWFDAFSYQMEATLVDMVNKTSYNTYISPRRFADVAFGMNQAPQDVTASRAWAVNYTNTTNKTIFVSVHVRDPSGGNLSASLYIGGTLWAKAFMTGGSETTLEGPVAPGGSYALFREDTNDLIMKWTEFR